MTPVRMTIIKNLKTIQYWRWCEGKRTLLYCYWESKLVQPLWRTAWEFLKKLRVKHPYDPTIPLLGIYPEKLIIWKDTCTPMFIAALFIIAKTWKQHKCSLTGEWMNKLWYIYIYTHTYIYMYIHIHIYTLQLVSEV